MKSCATISAGEVEGRAPGEEDGQRERRRGERGEAADPEVGLPRPPPEPVGEVAAREGPGEAGHHHHRAELDRGDGPRHARGPAPGRRASRTPSRPPRRCTRRTRPPRAGRGGWRGAAGRWRGAPRAPRASQGRSLAPRGGSGRRRHHRPSSTPGAPATTNAAAPAEPPLHQAAHDVAERGADGDGGEEDRVRPRAPARAEPVGEQPRRDGAVGGLADPDRRARREQRVEAPRRAGQHRGGAPEQHADAPPAAAPAAIAERPEHRRGERVDDDEARSSASRAGCRSATGRRAGSRPAPRPRSGRGS